MSTASGAVAVSVQEAQVFDSFSREVPPSSGDSIPAWGVSDTGWTWVAWSWPPGQVLVTDGKGVLTATTRWQGEAYIDDPAGPDYVPGAELPPPWAMDYPAYGYNLKMKFAASSWLPTTSPSGINAEIGTALLDLNGSLGVGGYVDFVQATGGVRCTVHGVSGSQSVIVPMTPGVYYLFEFDMHSGDSHVRFRLWTDGEDVPDWMIDFEDGSLPNGDLFRFYIDFYGQSVLATMWIDTIWFGKSAEPVVISGSGMAM